MKKELFAGILLAAMLITSFVNIHYLNKLTGQVSDLAVEAEKSAQQENWEEAKSRAEEAERVWTGSDSYTHIVLRHSEIDAATDSIYELLTEIYSKNSGGVKGAAQAVKEHMNSISSIEQLKPGSIF